MLGLGRLFARNGGQPPPTWVVWIVAGLFVIAFIIAGIVQDLERWQAESEFKEICAQEAPEVDCQAQLDEHGLTCYNFNYDRGSRTNPGAGLNTFEYHRCLYLGVDAYREARAKAARAKRRGRAQWQ